jgi:hypothetical protein
MNVGLGQRNVEPTKAVNDTYVCSHTCVCTVEVGLQEKDLAVDILTLVSTIQKCT